MVIEVTTQEDFTPKAEVKPEAKPVETKKESAPEQIEAQEETTEESDTSVDQDENLENDSEENDEASEEKEQEKPKKKNGFKKRIDKLSSRLSEREKELEYWKAQALNSQKPQEDQEPKALKQDAPNSSEDQEPNPDDFDSHSAYVKAVAKWTVTQEKKQLEAKNREEQAKTQQKKQREAHLERVKEFKKEAADFDEVIDNFFSEYGDDVRVSVAVEELILNSDQGPALLYELAKNAKEFERINSLSPLAAAREIGKLEARLAKSETSETSQKEEIKKVTKAPQPLKPLGSKSATVKKSIHDPDISQADYERLRREQMRSRA